MVLFSEKKGIAFHFIYRQGPTSTKLPHYLSSLIIFKSSNYGTRSQNLLTFDTPHVNTELGKIRFKYYGPLRCPSQIEYNFEIQFIFIGIALLTEDCHKEAL